MVTGREREVTFSLSLLVCVNVSPPPVNDSELLCCRSHDHRMICDDVLDKRTMMR